MVILSIIKGINIETKTEVAIKLELLNLKHNSLKIEQEIYKTMKNEVNFPKLHWFGTDGDYNIMVIELLGSNLEDLLNSCGNKFSPSTAFNLADQMVNQY